MDKVSTNRANSGPLLGEETEDMDKVSTNSANSGPLLGEETEDMDKVSTKSANSEPLLGKETGDMDKVSTNSVNSGPLLGEETEDMDKVSAHSVNSGPLLGKETGDMDNLSTNRANSGAAISDSTQCLKGDNSKLMVSEKDNIPQKCIDDEDENDSAKRAQSTQVDVRIPSESTYDSSSPNGDKTTENTPNNFQEIPQKQTVITSSETTETFIADNDDNGCEISAILDSVPGEANQLTNGEPSMPLLAENSERPVKNLDDVLMDLKFGLFHVKMLILTGGAYFAICAQIMCLVFLSTPIKKEWNLSKYSFSWLPFSTGVSGIIGGYVVGTLSDRFGRQKPFLVSMVLCLVFGLASPLASSFGLLITLRAFVSMGIGGLSAVNFVLLLEFLPRKNRGCHMVIITLCGALGAVLAGGLAWLLLEQHGWRVFLATCAIPSFVVVVLRIFISYESPRYLLTSNQPEKARQILQTIADNNKTTLPQVDIECPANKERGRIQDLFSPQLRRRTIFASFVWILQSMGFWGVTMYMPEYMIKQGVDPYFSMFTIFIGEIPGLLLAMILIERHMFGRLRCLRFFSICTCVCLVVFALVSLDFLRAVFAVVCYFFMVPVYSILNTLTPEIYPTCVRSTALAWMNIIIEIPSLVTPFVGEILLSSPSPWLYPIVWASCFLLQLIFSFGLTTETAGRNLDDASIMNQKPLRADDSEMTESDGPIRSGMLGCEVKLQLAHTTVSDSESAGCEFF